MNTAKQTVIPILLLLIASIAFASVFAYYPLTITVSPQVPVIVFQQGSNAGQPDIGTAIITVTLGANSTSASVRIHPTYQDNYYKDVLKIYNGDNDAVNVYLIFDSVSNTLPFGSVVKLFVYDGATKIKELDITNPSLSTPISIGTIASGRTWQIDFYAKIAEGTRITGTSYSATTRLIYTPSTETPPVIPSS